MADDPTDETAEAAATIEPAEPPAVIEHEVGVGAEYADPEPDEDSAEGDLVQLVRTGWVRFVIAGHGRVRFRPPRFGELRHIMVAYEAMVDEIQERSHTVQALADNLNAQVVALDADRPEGTPPPTPEERHKVLLDVTLQSRQAGREMTTWREDQYLQWWAMVHAGDEGTGFRGLGVSGEELPPLDGMPLWLAAPNLAASVLGHWQAVPLDRGRR